MLTRGFNPCQVQHSSTKAPTGVISKYVKSKMSASSAIVGSASFGSLLSLSFDIDMFESLESVAFELEVVLVVVGVVDVAIGLETYRILGVGATMCVIGTVHVKALMD